MRPAGMLYIALAAAGSGEGGPDLPTTLANALAHHKAVIDWAAAAAGRAVEG